MAKKLNKNLVIGLAVVGFAITTAAGVAMVKFLQHSDPTEFATKADQLAKSENSEDWVRALQYYNRAYRASKNDAQYLVKSADMQRKLGREIEALQTYRSAVVVNPQLLDAQEKILDLVLEIADLSPFTANSWINVKTTAEAILEMDGQEKHPRALFGMGTSLLWLKEQSPENESRGVEFLKTAIEADPAAVDPVRRLRDYLYNLVPDNEKSAEQFAQNSNVKQAGAVIDKLVAQTTDPGEDAAEARVLLAGHLTAIGEYERAAEAYDQAQAMAGGDKEVQSRVHARAGQFYLTRWSVLETLVQGDATKQAELEKVRQAALTAAEKSIEIYPKSFDGYFLLAELHRREEHVERAIEVLQKRLDLPFERQGFQSLMMRIGRYSLLISLADLKIALAAGEERGSKKLEELAAQAEMNIEDALGEMPERPEASHSSGKLAYIRGEFTEAVKWFERADEQGATSSAINLYYLALARMRVGQLGGALEAIERAVAMKDATANMIATFAQILLRLERPREAVSAAEEALRRDPGNSEARVTLAAAYEALGETKRVQETLKSITTDRLDITVAKARFLADQKQEQEALNMLLAALEKNPANPMLISAIAHVYTSMDRGNDARTVIDEALKARPGDFDLQLIKLQYSEQSTEQRREAYTELIKTLPDEYDRAVRLATLYAEDKDDPRQRVQLETAKDLIIKQATASARQAGEPALRMLLDRLIELYARTEDFAALDKLIDDARAWNDGAGLDGAEGMSYRGRRILIDAFLATQKASDAAQQDDAEAAKRWNAQAQKLYQDAINALQLALDRFPTSGETYAQLGEAFLQSGRVAEARAAMEKANDLLPRNAIVLKRLTMICRRMGDEGQYRTLLAQCKEIMPDDPWVAEQLLVADEEANPREGIMRREQIRASNPQDVQNLAALVRLYRKIGDNAKAEECIEAIITADAAHEFVEQTASLLREIGKPDRALTLLEQNLRDVPTERKADAQILLADHYAKLNDRRADSAYLAAADIQSNETVCLAIGQHFLRTGRPAMADEWLAKASEQATASNSVRLAMIYQIRIDTMLRLDRIDDARKLCDEFKTRFKDDPAGDFLDAEILSAKGDVTGAINTLTRYLEKSQRVANPLNDYRRKVAMYRRAQLYRHQERWQDVINDLVALVASDPAALDFKPRLLLAMAYERAGRPDAAIAEFESVYRDYPNATSVVQELVDRYVEGKRYSDADRILAAMLNREPESVGWLVRSGNVAVEQGDRTKALSNYKLAAKLSGYSPAITNKLFSACLKFSLPEQGIEFFEKSIPPGQQNPEVVLGYARMLAARGDAGSAVEMCRLALHRRGYDSFDFMLELVSSARTIFGADAIKRFQEPLREPVFERANQHIVAMLHQFADELAEADAINRALLEGSTDPKEQSQVWFRIGLSHDTKNESTDAQNAYLQALKFDKENLAALNNLAYLLTEKLNQPAEAVEYARQAVNISMARNAPASTVVAALDTLGWALLCAGQNLTAIAKLNQALDIDPDYIPATLHLAEAFRRESQFEICEPKFQEVLKLPPGSEYEEYREKAREGLEKTKERRAD